MARRHEATDDTQTAEVSMRFIVSRNFPPAIQNWVYHKKKCAEYVVYRE